MRRERRLQCRERQADDIRGVTLSVAFAVLGTALAGKRPYGANRMGGSHVHRRVGHRGAQQ
jgi:hypothetical protein